jgi:polar amino acid transport system substrate-binding protein
MLKLAIALQSTVFLASLALTLQVAPAARSDLAPTGKLRVGINFGNALLASKDPASGKPQGIAVDLANELGRRMSVPVEIVSYDAAGRMADGVKTGAWDVAFLGAEPERANEIAFSTPYLEIEATYLVPAGSPLRTIADVDREGTRIAVSEKSAYDLFLTRNLKRARLMRTPGADASVVLFTAEKMDALAGLKPALLAAAEKIPGSRVLEGRFTVVQQAVGTPKDRDAGAKYLREFVEDVKASGFVGQAIKKNAIRGVTVAPKGS